MLAGWMHNQPLFFRYEVKPRGCIRCCPGDPSVAHWPLVNNWLGAIENEKRRGGEGGKREMGFSHWTHPLKVIGFRIVQYPSVTFVMVPSPSSYKVVMEPIMISCSMKAIIILGCMLDAINLTPYFQKNPTQHFWSRRRRRRKGHFSFGIEEGAATK